MSDLWDSARCNYEPAGAGLINAAHWFGKKRPDSFPTDKELTERLSSKLKSHPKVDLLISHKGGMGDTLMCSTVAHELRRRGVKNIWLETRWQKDFQGQPGFDGVLSESFENEWLVEKMGGRIIYPAYARSGPDEDKEIAPNGHILSEMCRQAGILGEITLRPYFEIGADHYRYVPREFVAISGVGGHAVLTKDWYHERFQALAGMLKRDIPLVQLGTLSEQLLAGADDLRAQTDIRQAASILKRARCFVGEVGGLMHLARAVDCPSVVIFGGREATHQSGYTANINIVGQVPCSPCWIIKNCPHDMACMDMIHPEAVASKVKQLLDRGSARPLQADKFVIE